MEIFFDFSNLQEFDPLKNDRFQIGLNRFKIETPDHKIIEAVSLQSKVYALSCTVGFTLQFHDFYLYLHLHFL